MGVRIRGTQEAGAGEPPAASVRRRLRTDPTARRIARRWRALAREAGRDGARVLVACSGGADSTALALALAAHRAEVVIGHVRHDLRSAAETGADLEAARSLAARVGARFESVEAPVAPGENAEAAARAGRYRALEAMAREAGASLVATAHHADDQLETVLMALMRGAGPRGLSGVAERRPLGDAGVALIRPMLTTTRAEARALCERAGVGWREDATNGDTTRARAYLRHEVIAALVRDHPEAARRSARTARLMGEIDRTIAQRARALLAGAGDAWPRDAFRGEPRVVVGEAVRAAVAHATGGRLVDRLGGDKVDAIAAAITDARGETLVFEVARGCRVEVGRATWRVVTA
jgi:tRNA(Ile)-lysidine synthase